MVFGESVLNDAVAIVLSTTLLTFNTPGAQVDTCANPNPDPNPKLSTTLLTFNTPGAQVDVDTASIMR